MAFLLLLTGCQSSQDTVEEETTNNTASMESFDDTYYNIVKFEDSELREDFYLDYGATSDFSSIGRGLQILSSQYFSTSFPRPPSFFHHKRLPAIWQAVFISFLLSFVFL